MDKFDIRLRSLHIFGGNKAGPVPHPGDMATWECLSEESRGILDEILIFLEKEIARSDTKEYVIENLRESVFGLCLEEGFLMLTGGLDKPMRHAVLGGFLIPSGVDLRTAWHFARWQLLLISATSWNRAGDVYISLTEINQMAADSIENIKLLDERRQTAYYMDKLQEIGKDMMESAMPFSYAMTAFNKNRLMLDFRKGYQSAETISTATGTIPIAQIDLDKYDAIMHEKYPFTDIRLDFIDTDKFAAMKSKEGKRLGNSEAARDRAFVKNAKEIFPSGKVWCYTFTSGDSFYSYPLEPVEYEQLYRTGAIDFDNLYKGFKDAYSGANRFFGKMTSIALAEKIEQTTEKKGLFGSLFKGKNT
ncbi:MAG: hypothetical protein ILP19_07535 [Oscillospiraceae bacterium]|nr:hypothetical protein [Oscillospiraceae bacterium]